MTKKILKNKFSGFTLIELMIGLVIFSLIMTMILSSVHSMTLARIKNMNRIALTDQLYLFSEQLFTTIKNGGTIDYEEYWNRNSFDTNAKNWHYEKPSGMGNYGSDGDLGSNFLKNFYYCLSGNGAFMGTNGCLENSNSENAPQKWNMQRFGQYEFNFWDMNGNQNNDDGDEDKNNEIIGDEDDFNLWNGPEVFAKNSNGEYVEPIELYLIDKQKKKRTFLRWRLITDPRSKTGETCNKDTNGNWNEHCLGNIQILKMDGYDLWLGHNSNSNDLGLYDGKIDTWVCETGWNCQWWDSTAGKIATGKDEEWINLFPADINVRNFRINIYPKKDPWLAAADSDCPQDNSNPQCVSPFIHPYVRFTLELGFAKWARRSLQWENPIISISSTISLDDFR